MTFHPVYKGSHYSAKEEDNWGVTSGNLIAEPSCNWQVILIKFNCILMSLWVEKSPPMGLCQINYLILS